MSTSTSPAVNPDPPVAPDDDQVNAVRPLSFGRLLAVELRKSVDTRASQWLLGLTVAACLLLLVALWLSTEELGGLGLQQFLAVSAAPLSLFMPIVAITAATSEWVHRTGLVTFSLEPRRVRVAAAKLVVALALTAAAYLVVAAVTAATVAVAGAVQGVSPDWGLDAAALAGDLGVLALAVVRGFGLGLLLASTTVAVAVFILVPTLLPLLGLWERTAPLVPWIDPASLDALVRGGEVSGQMWGHAATSFGLWVLVPLVLGAWLLLRREMK